MKLIRRQRVPGRRAVLSKLGWIKANMGGANDPETWEAFQTFAVWVTIGKAWAWSSAVAQGAIPSATPYDGMLPWYFREMQKRLAADETPTQRWHGTRAAWIAKDLSSHHEVRDWYVDVRPNIMQYNFDAAVAAARTWHQNIAAAARALEEFALQPKHRDPFTKVKSFPDGFFITRYDVPEGASHKHLRALGSLLGHCYAYPKNAAEYGENYDLWTLFSPTWMPHWTLATTSMGDRADPRDIKDIVEVKGRQNFPVVPEHFPYLEAFLRPSVQRFGMGDHVLDYFNAEALHEYAKPGSVEILEEVERIQFKDKDGRNFGAFRVTENTFDLYLFCGARTFVLLEDARWSRDDGTRNTMTGALDGLLVEAYNRDDWPC